MRGLLVLFRWVSVAAAAAVLSLPLPAASSVLDPTLESDEGCEAQNPLQPKCSFKVTHTSSTPVTGVGGIGDWIVKVDRDGETLVFESLPDGRPTIHEISFKIGDEVKARAVSPGSSLTVGHFDP